MARIRQVKPDFFRHEALFELEKHTASTRQAQGKTGALPVRVAFCGLWTACDREGRFRWKPRQLKLDVLPYDDLDFEEVLEALESKGFVISYIVDGEKYGYIPSWKKHQQPHSKEKASTLPAPCLSGASTGLAPDLHSSLTPDSGLRNTDTDSGYSAEPVPELDGNGGDIKTADLNGIECSIVLCRERRITDKKLIDAIGQQIDLEAKESGKSCESASLKLVAAMDDYDQARPKLEYTVGLDKFIGQGIWRKRELWPWKAGREPTPIDKPRLTAKQKLDQQLAEEGIKIQ
jgi:hypothetical protein